MKIALYIAVMAVVTYLIRMIPFTLLRKKITSPFFKRFLQYIPYTVLAAMTVPAIFYSTENPLTAVIGTAVALFSAYLGSPMMVTAVLAAVSVWLGGLIL